MDPNDAITVEFMGLNLIAPDVDATLAFYRLLGFSFPDDAVWRTGTGAHHVSDLVGGSGGIEFDSQALARHYNEGFDSTPSTTTIHFRVGSRAGVDALYERLVAAGHPGRQQPYDAFWGARYAIVSDPDGRDVGLMSERDPALNRPPPDL